MIFEYRMVFSIGSQPDLTEVNAMAQEGWDVIQLGQSTSEEGTRQWHYLLKKQATPGPLEK